MKAAVTGPDAAAIRRRTMQSLRASGPVAVFACAGMLCVSAPAFAAGPSKDVAATRAYLRASEAYSRGVSAELGASEAAIAAMANEIARECPSVLTYAPRDEAFGEVGYEVSTTLFYAAVAVTSATRLGFVQSVSRLSWSDHRLTRLVRSLATEESAVVATGLPDVCADIDGWKASAYATLPQSATAFLAHVEKVESAEYIGRSEQSREALIGHLLGAYEGPGERRTMKLIGRSEQHTFSMLGTAEEADQAKLATALGVSTL